MAETDNVLTLPIVGRRTCRERPDTVFVEHAGMRTAFASPDHLADELGRARATAVERRRRAQHQASLDPATAPLLSRLQFTLAAEAVETPFGAVVIGLALTPAMFALCLRIAEALS